MTKLKLAKIFKEKGNLAVLVRKSDTIINKLNEQMKLVIKASTGRI
jgi:murein L,D-transpeptidase YafK